MSISSMRFRSLYSTSAILALGFAAVRSASGQTLDRSVRPTAPAPKPAAFPAANVHTLPNGMRLVIVENHGLPVVAARVALAFDSSADLAGKGGLFSLTYGMLREGTASRTADQLSTAIGALGNDVTPIRFTTVTGNADSSLAIMADLLMHPSFPQDAVERRKAALAAAVQRQSQVASLAPHHLFYSLVLGSDNPIVRSLSATESSVKALTRDDVTRFYEEHYRPENVTLIVVGDVRDREMLATITRLFGSWQSYGPALAPRPTPPATAAPTTIYLLDRPNATQAVAFVGGLGPSRLAGDASAMEVLAPILGSISSSRLAKNIRDRHAYMYSGTLFAAAWQREPGPSLIFGSGAFAPAKTDSALFEWISELKAIRADRPPTEDEMKVGRASISSTVSNAIETVDRLADRLVALASAKMPLDYYNRLMLQVANATSAQVSAAAAAHIDPDHLVIVVAGNRAILEPALRAMKIGPVVIVDESAKGTK
jgi:zinc protease